MSTVLIIDDSVEDQKKTEVILSSAGYSIIGKAINGEDGIRKFRNLKPDLVLIDLILPGLNGIETLRAIRIINPKAMGILCSSIGQHDIVTLAMRNGANGYVVKPFNPEILLNSIRRIFECIM